MPDLGHLNENVMNPLLMVHILPSLHDSEWFCIITKIVKDIINLKQVDTTNEV